MAVGRTSAGWIALAIGVAVATACGPSAPSAHERFDAPGVDVEIHLERSDSATTVVATFQPLRAGLRLYGRDLPMDGNAGSGRPTRVDVVDAGWRAVGPPQTSVVAEDVTVSGFDEKFPVFPDGPVTLRQAVEAIGDLDDGRIDIAITFMACTAVGACLPPVERHAMSLPTG